MAQMTSGKVLREARERKEYDLVTVARRLRIRPDILRAIEAGDFSSMPPRGYTRNMVNAYARLLGLNPTEIVNMYLDEAYAYQVERARGSARGSGFVMERDAHRPVFGAREDNRSGSARDGRSNAGYDEDATGAGRTRVRTRQLYDDRTPYSRDDYGVQRERVERPGRSDRDFLSHHSGYASSGYADSSGRSSRRRERTVHVGQTPMEYSAPRFAGIFQQRGVLIAAIVLAVLVVIAIIVFVTRGSGAPAEDDVSQLPVSGISDTTGTADDDSSAATVEIAPTSARVVMTVADGDKCYIETYTDGGEVDPDMLTGPTEKTVEVTGTWTITTYTPDYIKVTVNGEAVQLTVSDEYEEMYAYTVDFPKLLEEWKSTHTSRDSQRQAAVAEATNAQQTQANSNASADADDDEEDDDQ